METKEFSLKPEKQKKRGNWKGKLAAALAGVLGASVIGPAVASIMPETVEAGNGSSPTQSVKTWAEFKAAVEQGGTVYIGADIVVEETLNIDKTVRLYSDSTSNQYKIVRLYNTKTYNNGTLESDIRADFKGTIFNVSGNGNLIINENIILSGDKGTKNVKKTSSNSVCTEDSQYGFRLTALASSDIASDVPQKRAANSSDYEVELANYVFKVGDDAFWAVGGESGNYNLGTYTSWDITKHNNRNTYKPRATWSLIGSYYSSGRLNYYYLKNTETGQILYYNTNSGNLGYGITSSKPTETYRRWKSPIINFNDGNKLQYKAADNKGDKVIRGLYRIDRDYSSCLNGSGAGTQTSIDNDIESYAWRSSEINSNIGYFIDQNAGSVTIDGATIKDLTINDTSVKNVAPIYVSGGTFTMDSGDIVNNSVGYLDEQYNDWFSGQTANRILEITNTKLPRTETAGAIIFAGGEGHNINGGNIFGNRADTGAIVIKTPKDGNGGEKTKVTFGADEDETKKPIIGGNIGIHYAGAVYINPGDDADSASFIMKGGEIKDNFTWYKGGAIFASCEKDGYGHGTKRNAVAQFMMDGGLIDNNTAVHRGGAIEVMSDQVYLKKGKITNNNSRVLGGAIYIEGDRADRTYTLYIPDVYITENHAWTETKTGKEDNDYAYLKRKLLYDAGAVLENGNYTYNNPLGNVRSNNNGTSLNRGSENSVYEGPDSSDKKGKKAWTEDPKTTEARRWDLADGKTSDYKDYGGYSGHGGGIWTCSLGGYASVNFLDKSSSGAIVKNNYTNLSTPNDITAHSKDGGFILSDSDLDNHGPSEYIATNKGNIALNWNTLYSGGDYDIKNGTDISATPPENYGGVIISKNNARNGGAIAANGKLILGKANDVYEHRAEVEFEKAWDGIEENDRKPVAFQAYIGGKAVPGYQFVLDGTPDPQGNREMLLNVYESDYYKASISLPYGLDETPTFIFDIPGVTTDSVSTQDSMWDFGSTGTLTGNIKDWNFEIKEMPVGKKTISNIADGNYLLIKKKNDTIAIGSTDRDYNFTNANGYSAPTSLTNGTDIQGVIGGEDSILITGFGANNSDLYFVKSVTVSGGSITFDELLNGDYTLVPYTQTSETVDEETIHTWTCGSNKTDFSIKETETKYATSPMEEPDKVSLAYTETTTDQYGYSTIFGDDSVFTTHTTTATAYRSGENNQQLSGTRISNSNRPEAEVEKYINGKVDETLNNISTQFRYDIIARVPDQAEEFVISDTLVDWIGFVNGNNADVTLKVLGGNDHKENGTVDTHKVGDKDVLDNTLTTALTEKAKKIVLNDTLTVRVDDKDLVRSLAGKYIQITVNAEIKSDHYEDVFEKVEESNRQVTYNSALGNDDKVAYALRNDFNTDNRIYRLYKVADDKTDGLWGPSNASEVLKPEEIKALGISDNTRVVKSNILGKQNYGNFLNENGKAVFKNLTPGKYVLHVIDGTTESKANTNLELCEVFEIIDGDEDIRWVSVAGESQDSLPEAFKNDSPYMGENKQQSGPQVITGKDAATEPKKTSDDPLHDGIGNRATFAVTYRGGRQQTLKSNTVTVEPLPETPKIEKYVNKKVDDTLAGFDSNFTYDIMAYIPNGVSTVVIDDTLVDWLEFASTENTLNQIRVLSDNDHIGNGSGTVATGSVNGNTKVVDVALDNKYTVEKTGNKLKVTINDRDTITKLWGNWVQVTFDAKIKESAYGAVVSKLNEKTDENDNRASVTYSNSQDKGTFTVNIKDTDDYYYRLYSKDQGAVNGFLWKRPQNPDWVITNNSAVSEATREKFGLTDWTESARTLEFNSSNVTKQISAVNYRDYDSATGELVFKNLPTGSYFLYCFKKTGGGSEADRVVLGRCQAFEIDSKNFNWVEVDGGITFPKYLNSDTPVLDGSDAMHDGIGNRAGYTLSYGSSTVELKTNVVTVEPPKEEFEITKIWEGDNVTALTGEVETAFLNALQLKLDGVAVPDNLQTLFKERLMIERTDTDTWKIKVTLPKYQGKSNYTIREDLSLIQNDENIEQNIKDLLTGYTAKYEISLKDGKYKPDLDTEHYSYRMYRISSEGYNWSNISNEKAENTNIPESLYSMLHINKDTIVSGTVVIPDQKPSNYNDSDKSFTGLTNGKYFLYCWTKGQDEKSNPVVERCEVFEITGNNDHIIRSGNNAAGNGDIIHNTKKFEVKLKKVSSTNTSTGLTGASFSITKVRDASGNEVTDAPTQDFEAYGYDFVKSDLDPGIYRIHETKAPTGYNYLKGDFQVKINNDGTFKLESVTDGDTVTYDSEGVQFVVQDRPIELYKTLHVRKNWQNVNADEFDGNTVEIQIQSDYATEGQFLTVNTIEINKDDNWKKDVTTDSKGKKLPLYNGTRVVNYKIVETKVKDSTGEVICDYTDNDPGDDAYVNHVEENDPFATYAVAAKTYTTTSVSVSVGNGIKALTLKSGTRNVAMNAAVSGDSLGQAKAKKQAWMAYQVSDGVMLLCQQESSTSWRYLTYAYNSGTYMLHATYSNSNTNTDEGGYKIYDYTTASGTANRYAGWTFSNGKLSQYNSYNGAYYNSGYWNNTINYYTTYFTTTTGNVTVREPNKTESDTVSLVGKTSSSDATTVKLQRWNSDQNKWVDATSLQNNQYYRFIIGDAAATTTTTTTNSHSPKTYELDNTNPKSTVYSLFGNDVDLTKSYSEKIISSSSDLGTYFNGKTGCMGSSDLFGVLKNILYYGYSNDAENLKTQFTLSDDDLKYLTAYAITEYTKHYTDGYTDKVDHSYGLTGSEASRVPDSGNLRAAYKKLMTLVSNTDKNLLDGVDLKLYYTGDDTDKVLLSADITSEQTAVVNSKDEMITLKGKKTWNDNGNSMNERPNFIELQLYSDRDLENDMQPLGGKITVNKPSDATGDVWEFTLGSYPKYVTMSNGEKREILYEIREVNGGSFYTLFGEIQKTTVLGASTNFEAAYGYRKNNLFRSTWANSKYFLANNNNEKINAYCLNLDKSDPSKVSSYSDGVHYTKVHIGKALDFATNNISFGTGGSGTSGYKYLGHENEADLIKRLIKIQYYGYPNDEGNLLDDYNLSSDEFIYLTQYAVWEYTNWYGIGKSTSGNTQFDFSSDKVNYSFGLSGNTKISTNYLNEVGSNSNIVSSATKQKLRNAYKALMEMIESEEYTVPSNLELYVYKPTNGNSYQALIGIEVLELGELRFDFTNKVLDEVELPHTGGMGTLWIFLTGAGAVAAAITGLAVRSRRRKNIDDNAA